MRIKTNTRLMKRNRQIATNLFMLTFLVLIGGFFFVNINLFTNQLNSDPLLLLGQALVLPVAFILTLISIRLSNLWARRPYPEEVINESLKGLSNKSVIYHYFHIPARHVLISPQGIFTITTRWHNGKYEVSKDRWRSKAGIFSRFFSSLRMDGIGDPTFDAERAANHVQKVLQKIESDITVQPVLLFIDPRVNVEVKESRIPILFADPKRDNLTDYLRDQLRLITDNNKKKNIGMPLSDAQITQFEVATIGAATEADKNSATA
jgi:hypothetical protein